MPKPPLWNRILAGFLLWTAGRAVYFVYLGDADPNYRIAAELGFGRAVWAAQLLYAFLGIGAAVAMWYRWKHVVLMTLMALAIYSSLTIAQLLQMESDPQRARRAYAAGREARGLPVSDERLDLMFSRAGRRVTWAIGIIFCLAPVAVLLWRRRDFEPAAHEAPLVVLGTHTRNALLAEERRLASGDYGPSPLPDEEYVASRGDHRLLDPQRIPLDDVIAATCRRLFDSGTDLERTRRSISMDQCYTLITFARRASVFALRERNVDRVHEGLFALALIERERVDYRDILWSLSLLRHAALRLGGDVRQMFGAAASRAAADVAELFTQMCETIDEHSLQRDWGYAEVQTDKGIGLIRWGGFPYGPSVDLTGLIIAAAQIIDADRYVANEPEIATELPGVWLGETKAPAAATAALGSIRAVASVSGPRRTPHGFGVGGPFVLLFIAELPRRADVERLLDLHRAVDQSDVTLIPIVHHRLFGLLVASSGQHGVPTDETHESLNGMVTAIRAVMRRYVDQEE